MNSERLKETYGFIIAIFLNCHLLSIPFPCCAWSQNLSSLTPLVLNFKYPMLHHSQSFPLFLQAYVLPSCSEMDNPAKDAP